MIFWVKLELYNFFSVTILSLCKLCYYLVNQNTVKKKINNNYNKNKKQPLPICLPIVKFNKGASKPKV